MAKKGKKADLWLGRLGSWRFFIGVRFSLLVPAGRPHKGASVTAPKRTRRSSDPIFLSPKVLWLVPRSRFLLNYLDSVPEWNTPLPFDPVNLQVCISLNWVAPVRCTHGTAALLSFHSLFLLIGTWNALTTSIKHNRGSYMQPHGQRD